MLKLSCATVGAWLLLGAAPAWANGRFPASNQIVFSPSDHNLVILRTSYGVLPSHDNGATWQFLCEDAMGLPATTPLDPELALTKSNALVAAVTNEFRMGAPYLGLDVSPDVGCSWNCIGGPLARQAVSDVVVRPEAPDVVLAVTSTYLPMDAGGGIYSQVFESIDDGAHWSPLGPPIDPLVVVQTIDVAKTDPSRVYLSGTRGVGPTRTASLFVLTDAPTASDASANASTEAGTDASVDATVAAGGEAGADGGAAGGKVWAEYSIPAFDPNNEEFVWIAAVDPTDADRVYVRSSAPVIQGGKSRLYLTTNAGKTSSMILDFDVPPLPMGVIHTGIGELLGFALSPDGSKIYAGTKEKGLLMAAKADMSFQPVNPSIHVQCLATRGNELWACSDAVSGFVVGVSTDDGAHFCPKMTQITSVTGTVACDSNTPTTLACGATVHGTECKPLFDMFCEGEATACQADCPASLPATCQGTSVPDAAGCSSGVEEAGPGAEGTEAGPDGGPGGSTLSSGCACSSTGGGTAGGLLAFSAALVLGCRRRRARASVAAALLYVTGRDRPDAASRPWSRPPRGRP